VMSSMNFAASFDVTVVTAQTWIHLVNLSTACSRLGVVLNGPTESRPHMAKGRDGGIVIRT
jgi:hypothetical protein